MCWFNACTLWGMWHLRQLNSGSAFSMCSLNMICETKMEKLFESCKCQHILMWIMMIWYYQGYIYMWIKPALCSQKGCLCWKLMGFINNTSNSDGKNRKHIFDHEGWVDSLSASERSEITSWHIVVTVSVWEVWGCLIVTSSYLVDMIHYIIISYKEQLHHCILFRRAITSLCLFERDNYNFVSFCWEWLLYNHILLWESLHQCIMLIKPIT